MLAHVMAHLAPLGLAERVMEFSVSSATVEQAAQAVGCPPAQIAKTLSFLVGGQPLLLVVAGDAKIDNGKFKAQFHQKAAMIPPAQVEALTGFPVGGVCPFGSLPGVAVYLDASLQRFNRVYPAAGTPSSAVALSPQELYAASGAAGWVDVGRLTQP